MPKSTLTAAASRGTEVADLTLTGPARPSNEDARFVCSGDGCLLSGNTTYHLTLGVSTFPEKGNYYQWSVTNSNNQTVNPSTATGWAIGDGGCQRTYTLDIYQSWECHVSSGKFLVTVTREATLTASKVTGTSARLNLANYTRTWHYKHTTPTGGTCSVAQTGTSANVTGLTRGHALRLQGVPRQLLQ